MSDFWAQRLGRAPQPAAPVAPPAPAAPTQPWWMTKGRQQPAPQPPQVPGIVPSVDPLQTPQPTSVTPSGEATFSEMLTQTEYHSDKAQSAKDSETCPNCGSNNYVRASGQPNSMKQCFECGHNPRFEQMASGVSGIPTKGPVRAARVQTGNTPTWNPQQTITEHIG